MELLTGPDRETVINVLKKDKLTTKDFLQFSASNSVKNEDGTFTVTPNKISFASEFEIMKGDLINIEKSVVTTVGQAMANKLLFADVFGDIIKYKSETFILKKIQNEIVAHVMNDTISPEQFGKFQLHVVWLSKFGVSLIPSPSARLLTTPPAVKKLKEKLIKEHADIIASGDVSFVDKVEKPLLELMEQELKDDPSWVLYEKGGKPSKGNNLKNTTVISGLIYDPIEGKFHTSISNLLDGIDQTEYNYVANQLIVGTFNRAVNTRVGGAWTKKLLAAMNMYKAGVAGSDCGTKLTKKVNFSKDEMSFYVWNYIVDGNNLVLLTPDNIDAYYNRDLEMRAPLFCKSEGYTICNKCMGEIPYRSGSLNIGILTMRISSTLLNMSLKSFHDSTVATIKVDPREYMTIVN